MLGAVYTSYPYTPHANNLSRQILLDSLENNENETKKGKVHLLSLYHADSQKFTKSYLCVLKAFNVP